MELFMATLMLILPPASNAGDVIWNSSTIEHERHRSLDTTTAPHDVLNNNSSAPTTNIRRPGELDQVRGNSLNRFPATSPPSTERDQQRGEFLNTTMQPIGRVNIFTVHTMTPPFRRPGEMGRVRGNSRDRLPATSSPSAERDQQHIEFLNPTTQPIGRVNNFTTHAMNTPLRPQGELGRIRGNSRDRLPATNPPTTERDQQRREFLNATTQPIGPAKLTMAPSLAPARAPSFAPSTSRRADILRWAETISDPADLANVTSPQYRAATWVADEDELGAEQDNGHQLLQRYVLAVYYFSTGGDEWEECFRNVACVVGFSWLTGSRSECLWHGVRCTTDGKVQKILIGNQFPLGNNQVGTLPSELAELTDITSLVMLEGKIGGTIPTEFGRFTKIDSIFIQAQLLTGAVPEEIILNCRELQMLVFGNNYLEGPIPTNIAMLPKLLDLQLWGNKLTGTIPTEFGTVLDSLRNLELQSNFLGGTIPLTLFNNVNLTTLSLDNNELTGTIPEDLGQLTILRTFEVGGNQLVGSLPESIYTMPVLRNIRIENTGLGGSLSERLSELKQTLSEINAANTGFSGSLPLALSQLTNLNFLFLHGTQMTGTVPFTLCTAGLVNLTMPAAVDCSLTETCCTVQA